jgi:subtilisin family serine protease
MVRRRARLVFGIGVVLLALAPSSLAGADVGPGGSANESFQAWFVQFRTPPAAKGGSKATLASERVAFFKSAVDQGLSVSRRLVFDELWNGVSVEVPASQAGALATVPGVTAVYPVVPVSLPPSSPASTGDPDLRYATTLTGADVAQNELGLDGTGVKVAIIDSGLDYTLPEFGSCSSIGGSCRVAGGYDLVGDDYDANSADSTYQPIPHPDPDPAPCDPNVADQRAAQPGAGGSAAAHGTHVAGIVGADGRSDPDDLVTGVAPGATLYAYRVFGCNGSTSADIMAAAMEQAAEDHVNVLNMSIGAALNNFPNYPTAQAADNLVDQGITVVASIGNSGDTGLFSAGAPGVADKVIGVASVDNLKTFLPYFTAAPDDRHMGYTAATGAPAAPTLGTSPLAQTGTTTTNGDGCGASAPAAGSLTGEIALIRRGSLPAPAPACTFYLKAVNAQNAGAIGVVLYNNVPGRVSPSVAPPTSADARITIPVVAINAADGATLSDRITAGGATMTWTEQSELFDNTDTSGRTSSFSSWGTASDLTMKPDITAPGGDIRSTWPHQQHDGHWVIGGTSMASPHVAGAVALYLEAHPGTTPAAVRTALQNSADPVRFTTTSLRDSTARQGAGLLDVPGAVEARTVVSPAKISFGGGAVGNATITVTNHGASPVTYTLSSVPAVTPAPTATTQYPFTFGSFVGPTATFPGGSSVTLNPGASAAVAVSVNPAGLADKALYGGYVVLTPSGGGAVLRVPYLGFKGDYQSIQVIGNGGCNLPMLARLGAATDKIQCTPTTSINGLVGEPSGGIWEQPKRDPVVVLYHFNHQSSSYTLALLNAASGQPVTVGGRNPVVESIALVPRNSAPTTFFGSIWDGTLAFTTGNGAVQRKAAPGGVYKLRITITKVKALNDTREAGTESWTSPAFTLRSP